jgi:hypothetical protein
MRFGLVLIVCVTVLSGCARQTVLLDSQPTESNPAVRTFAQHGISFQYPGAWQIFQVPPPGGQSPGGAPPSVQPQQQSIDIVGVDALNNVAVAYGVSGLPSEDFSAWSDRIRTTLADRVAAHQERLLAEPEVITAAGFQALRYKVRVSSGLGYNLDVTWVGFIRGTTQFIVTCTSLPEREPEIQRGCQQILRTLHIS